MLNQSHTRYDILCLLLNLSEAPLKTTYTPPDIFTQEKPKQAQFKVSDIFREEPLVGPHWEPKNYHEDDDYESEWGSDFEEWIRERVDTNNRNTIVKYYYLIDHEII